MCIYLAVTIVRIMNLNGLVPQNGLSVVTMGYRCAQVCYGVSQHVEFSGWTNSPSNRVKAAQYALKGHVSIWVYLIYSELYSCGLLAYMFEQLHIDWSITPALIQWVADAQKCRNESKQCFCEETLLYTLFFPVHIKCASAIGKHNSGWRKNRGATLGGNLAN